MDRGGASGALPPGEGDGPKSTRLPDLFVGQPLGLGSSRGIRLLAAVEITIDADAHARLCRGGELAAGTEEAMLPVAEAGAGDEVAVAGRGTLDQRYWRNAYNCAFIVGENASGNPPGLSGG